MHSCIIRFSTFFLRVSLVPISYIFFISTYLTKSVPSCSYFVYVLKVFCTYTSSIIKNLCLTLLVTVLPFLVLVSLVTTFSYLRCFLLLYVLLHEGAQRPVSGRSLSWHQKHLQRLLATARHLEGKGDIAISSICMYFLCQETYFSFFCLSDCLLESK